VVRCPTGKPNRAATAIAEQRGGFQHLVEVVRRHDARCAKCASYSRSSPARLPERTHTSARPVSLCPSFSAMIRLLRASAVRAACKQRRIAHRFH